MVLEIYRNKNLYRDTLKTGTSILLKGFKTNEKFKYSFLVYCVRKWNHLDIE